MRLRSLFATVDWPKLDEHARIVAGTLLGERVEVESMCAPVFFGVIGEVVVDPEDSDLLSVEPTVSGPGHPRLDVVDFRSQRTQRVPDAARTRKLVVPFVLHLALTLTTAGEYRVDVVVNDEVSESLGLVVYPRGTIPPRVTVAHRAWGRGAKPWS